MGNHRDYQAKFLTVEQTAKLDDLIIANKHIYFSKKWNRSPFHAMKEEMKAELNKLIDKYFVDNLQSEEVEETAYWNMKKIFPKMRMSPEDFWVYRQTQRIREEVDTIMPALQPHQHSKTEDIIHNIREEVKLLHRKMEEHQLKAEGEGSASTHYVDSYPLVRFTTMVKVEFFNYLLQQYDGNSPVASSEKKITKSKYGVGTTNQQALTLYYLFEYAKLKRGRDYISKYADFTYFLTGRNHDNIRKAWRNLFKDNPKALVEDLEAIQAIFERIEAEEILKMVENDLRG